MHTPEYTLLQRHSAGHVELRFDGRLQNRDVTWHAHIYTLRAYCMQTHAALAEGTRLQAQQFIDIQVNHNQHLLQVGLNLQEIDEAAILRTIIMIRQYKRLQPGRHQYGDIVTLCFDKG